MEERASLIKEGPSWNPEILLLFSIRSVPGLSFPSPEWKQGKRSAEVSRLLPALGAWTEDNREEGWAPSNGALGPTDCYSLLGVEFRA